MGGLHWFTSWTLWRLGTTHRLYMLAVDAAAVVALAVTLGSTPVTVPTLATTAILLLLAVGQGEMSRRVDQARRRFAGAVHVNMVSVWVFAGLLLLPLAWACLLGVLIRLHLAVRTWRHVRGVHPYRTVTDTAALVLSVLAAGAVLAAGDVGHVSAVREQGGWAFCVLLAAMLVFFLVDGVIVAVAVRFADPTVRLTATFGGWSENVRELTTICLGALTAVAFDYQPLAVLLLLVPLFALHRSVLVRHPGELAGVDPKTGLLDAAAWRRLAEKELTRSQRHRTAMAVLMVDIDHFKQVNDTYGHLAGDEVLKAVAGLLRASTREHDTSGRFGGEEFAVLLPGTTAPEALAIAERLRIGVSELTVAAPLDDGAATAITGLSVSIGVAGYPHGGQTLDELLLAADSALYLAKDSGRNRVISIFG